MTMAMTMTMTESGTSAQADGDLTGPRLFGPRGRHRRPRPRKVLLAAGGLALAAGALSLVRLAPDTTVGGLGTAEAEDHEAPGTATDTTDRATNAAATVRTEVSPSATSVMGGTTATPTAGVSLAPAPSTTAAQPTLTTIPDAPNPPDPADTPQPSATTSTAPQPTPTPTPARTTPPPAPRPKPSNPAPTDKPGLCVPIIGLCVDPLTHHGQN